MSLETRAPGAERGAAADTHFRIKATCRRCCEALLLTLILAAGCSAPADAQLRGAASRTATAASSAVDAAVTEASARFGVPPRWIQSVIAVESNGDARAVSPKGALGLMQIMPDTWADLRLRYGFGDDPFDARDNILGGTAYLRDLYDRFGAGGFLAAYNAGPARYQRYLADGKPLAVETRLYLAKLAARLPELGLDPVLLASASPPDWRGAGLFAMRSPGLVPTDLPLSGNASADRSHDPGSAAISRLAPLSLGLFTPISSGSEH